MVDMREKLNERLRRLSELQDNWDGDGASAPREEYLKQAQVLVEALASGEFEIDASRDGYLTFFWERQTTGAPAHVIIALTIVDEPAEGLVYIEQTDEQ